MSAKQKSVKNRSLVLVTGCWLLASFTALSLGTSLFGQAGGALEHVLVGSVGFAAWGWPLVLFFAGLTFLRRRPLTALRVVGDMTFILIASSLVFVFSGDESAAGIVGSVFGGSAENLFSVPGTVLVAAGLSALIVLERLNLKQVRKLFGRVKKFELPRISVIEPVADHHGFCDDSVNRIAEPAHEFASLMLDKPKLAYLFPPTSILEKEPELVTAPGVSQVGSSLVRTLAAYDVEAKVEEVVRGPTVTTFELAVAAGVKFSRVVGLADDLSLALGRKVRIVAGRFGRVGVEVQNEKRQQVGLRALIEAPEFVSFAEKASLPIAMGRDVRGELVKADLASMPHLFVAGATGSGKSVFVSTLLASLVFFRLPEECQFVLVDPKEVELSSWSRIPHLAKFATDSGSAREAFEWCVKEMDWRYKLLASTGNKNLETYNRKNRDKRLPHIVVVVDELADLMMADKKRIEPLLVRLAQKARAAGIHLVLATQRPSVDVITGLLKANVPSRVAFRTSQGVDSRVILDEQGAELLTGKGDALVRLSDGEGAERVQCPMLSEVEIEAIVSHFGGMS